MVEERWDSMARDSLTAAGICLRGSEASRGVGHARSAVSRAYYAAFSKVTAMLLRLGERPPNGWSNWKHKPLVGVLRSALTRSGVAPARTKEILHNLRASYSMRLDADYQPGRTVDRNVAQESLRKAAIVMNLLEKCA
jgi:uncharacterized protein (UPF0332 family)